MTPIRQSLNNGPVSYIFWHLTALKKRELKNSYQLRNGLSKKKAGEMQGIEKDAYNMLFEPFISLAKALKSIIRS